MTYPLPKDGLALCLVCGRKADGWLNIRHKMGCLFFMKGK